MLLPDAVASHPLQLWQTQAAEPATVSVAVAQCLPRKQQRAVLMQGVLE